MVTKPTCIAARTRDCYTKKSATTLAFKNTLLKPFRGFRAWEAPVSLHGPAINLSLFQTLTFWFVCPPCVSST